MERKERDFDCQNIKKQTLKWEGIQKKLPIKQQQSKNMLPNMNKITI